jgi:hypothetical protein
MAKGKSKQKQQREKKRLENLTHRKNLNVGPTGPRGPTGH